MSAYRVYQLDAAGRIVAADWVEAASDGQAEAQASEFCKPGIPSVELWRGPRRIALFNCPEARGADPPG